MPKLSTARVFSREFKLAAVRRMLAGENISALARELEVLRKDLYVWRNRFRAGGPEALRPRGRPRKDRLLEQPPERPPDRPAVSALSAAQRRIAELERKIGQQQVVLDFFQRALRHVKAARRPSDRSGVTGSTRSSKR
jgi:transposase